jgi:hypothetical protein
VYTQFPLAEHTAYMSGCSDHPLRYVQPKNQRLAMLYVRLYEKTGGVSAW